MAAAARLLDVAGALLEGTSVLASLTTSDVEIELDCSLRDHGGDRIEMLLEPGLGLCA